MSPAARAACRLSGLIAAVLAAFAATPAQAVYGPKYFVSSSTATVWDEGTTADWSDVNGSYAGPFTFAWGQWDNAYFGVPSGGTATTGGTVNVSGAVYANTIQFDTSGYLLQGGTIIIGGANGAFTVASGCNDSIASTISTPNTNFWKTGAGTLTLSGSGSTFNGGGYVYVNQGTMAVTAGSIGMSNLFVLGQAANSTYTPTYLQSGGYVTTNNNSTYVGNVGGDGMSMFSVSGGSFTCGSGALYISTGSLGTVNLSNSGVVTAAYLYPYGTALATVNLGDNATFSGGSGIGNGGTSGVLAVGYVKAGSNLAFNFEGGTLQATAANTSFFASLGTATVQDAGGIINNGGYAITIAQAFAHGGTNSTDGGLILTGSGVTTLSGANTYNGPTVVSAGTLVLGNASALQNSTLNISGGTVSLGSLSGTTITLGGLQGAGNINLNGSNLYVGGNSATTAYAGILSAGVALVKNGTGSLTLSGSNTFSGECDPNAGTLSIAGGQTAIAARVNLANSSTPAWLSVSGGSLSITGNYFCVGDSSGAGHFVQTGGTTSYSAPGYGLYVGNGSSPSDMTFSGGSFNATAQLTYVGVHSSGTMNIGGSAAVTLGALQLGFSGQSGVGTVNLNGGTLGASSIGGAGSNGTLTFNGGTLWATGSNSSFMSGLTAAYVQTGGGTINSGSSNITIGQILQHGGSGTDGGLAFTGSGATILSAANTYNGGTTISGGTLQLGNAAALGATTGNLSVNGGVLDIHGYGPTTGPVTLTTGRIVNNGAAATLSGTSYNLQSGSISANLGDQGGSPLTMSGPGVAILSGSNSYNGGTTVSGGTLQLGSAAALPAAGGLNVNGGVLDIHGTGPSTGPVTLMGGSIVNSGAATTLNGTSYNVQSGSVTAALGGNTAGLAKTTAGTVTLSAANSYGGGTTVSGGLLQLGNAAALGTGGLTANAGTLDLAGNSPNLASLAGLAGLITDNSAGGGTTTLAVNQSGNTTFGGVIQNGPAKTLALTLGGPGNLTLGGVNTFSGLTTVSSGTLSLLSGATHGNGSLTISPGAMLDVSAMSSGYTFSTGTLTAGRSGAAATDINGSFGVQNATMNVAGTNLPGTLAISGNLALSGGTLDYDLGATSDLISVGGALTLGGNDYIVPSALVSAGTYTLFTYASGTDPSVAGLSVSGPFTNPRQSYTFGISGGSAVTVIVAGLPGNLTWTGAASATWDTNATTNWFNASSGTADMFQASDNVIFDDNGSAQPTVSISGTVQPTSVTVNNNAVNYVFANGTIGGVGTLLKSGSGTLSINNSNSYTGGTTLAAGTLDLNNASAIGSGTLTIAGGTLGNTSGAALTLTTNNPQLWNADVVFAGSNDLNLGTGPVTLGSSRTVTTSGGNLTVGGPIGGVGFSLTKNGAGGLTLAAANTYNSGTVVLAGTLTAAADSALGPGPVTMTPSSGTAVLAFTSATPTIGSLANGGAGSSSVVLGNAAAPSPTTLTLGGNGTSTSFSGTISDAGPSAAGSLVKMGSGVLYLYGSNTYTGGTTLAGGTLMAGNLAALGSGLLTFSGGTLQSSVMGSGSGPAIMNNLQVGPAAGSAINAPSGYNLALGGNLTGSGTLTKIGAYSVCLSGNNAAFSGTYINSASNTFFASGSSAASDAASWVLNSGDLANTLTGAQAISLGSLSGAGGKLGNNVGSSLVTYTVGDLGANTTFSGSIVDSVGGGGTTALVKGGGGMLSLNNLSTYTGGTTVSGGTLSLGVDVGNGTGTLAAGIPITVNAGATLNVAATDALGYFTGSVGTINLLGGTMNVAAGIHTNVGPLHVTGGTVTAAGAADTGDANYIINANVTTNASAASSVINAPTLALRTSTNTNTSGPVTFTVADGAAPIDLLVSSAVQSSGAAAGVIKAGPGLMQLSGNNSYTGGTTLAAGTLQLGNNNGLGSTSGTLEVDAGTLDLAGYSPTVGPLSGLSGTILSSGTATSTLTTTVSSGVSTFGGQFTSGAGTLALTKAGSGTLVLTATNQCAGTINLTGGTLAVPTGGALTSASRIYVGGTGGATLSVTGGLVSTSDNEYWALSSGVNANQPATVNITGGTLALTGAGSGMVMGNGGTGATVQWTQTGGLFTAGNGTIYLANAAGGVTQMSLTGGTFSTTSAIELGERDNATITVGGTALANLAGDMYINAGNGSATQIDTLNVSGGTVLQGASGNNFVVGNGPGVGIFNQTGGLYHFSGAGGTYIGNGTNGSGIMTVSGGTFTQDTNIVRLGQNGTSAGTLNVGGGTATAYVNLPAITFGSNSASASGTLNLYANGILNVGALSRATGSGTFNFNGGTLQASGNNSTFLSGLTAANVLAGGAIVDSQTSTITIAQSLLNGTGGGVDGGLTKVGAGTLILAGGNTYTGGTSVEAGTLRMANNNALGAGNLTVNAGTLDLASYSPSVGALGGAAGTILTNSATSVTLTANVASSTAAFGGTIANGAGAVALVVGGAGTQVLSGSNTYTGGTTINSGALQLGDGQTHNGSVAGNILDNGTLSFANPANQGFSGAISGTGAVNVLGPAVLVLTNSSNTSSGLTTVSGGTLQLGDGTSLLGTVGGPISDNAVLTFANYASQTFSGAISGTGAINVAGAAVLTLLGDSSAFNGATTITAGALQLGDGLTNDGLLGGTVVNNGMLTIANPAAQNFTATLGGSGGLTMNGPSVLTLSASNGYSGGTTVNGGTLLLGNSNALGSGAVLVAGGMLDLGSFSPTLPSLILASGTLTAGGGAVNAAVIKNTAGTAYVTGGNPLSGANLSIADGQLLLGTAQSVGGLSLTGGTLAGSTLTVSGPAPIDAENGVISANVAGAAGLDKTTANTVLLSGNNSYAGGTSLEGGLLQLGSDAALPSTGGLTVNSGTLDLAGHNPTSASLAGIAGVISNSTGAATLNVNTTVAPTTFNGSILDGGGTVGLVKSGTGTLTIANAANNYSGGTTVANGVLALGSATALGSISSALEVDAGTLDLAGNSLTVGALSGAGGVITSSVTGATLTAGSGDGTSTLNGVIVDGAGTVALVKVGSGTLTLASANNYSGGTTISGGELSISNSSNLGSGNVTIGAGALQTTGTVVLDAARRVTLTDPASAIDTPRATDNVTIPGLITGSGALNKTGAGTLALADTSGNTYTGDTNVVAGALLVEADNALSPTSNLVIGDGASVILDFGGGELGTDTAAFSGAPAFSAPALATPALAPAGISTVPEPSTLMLLLVGALAGLTVWRRRK